MADAQFKVPDPVNEPVLTYAPGTKERKELQAALKDLRSREIDIPMYIGKERVTTDEKIKVSPPHDHKHVLGYFNKGEKKHVEQAISAAVTAQKEWEKVSWEHRASVFLKAADLIAGPYRAKMNAATMLGQSKNAFQAEIDSACEIADFLRFNVKYMEQIYTQQPESVPGVWNRSEYRPIEGFIFALTPFNFTAIAGNLPTAPAIMGNVAVWKPAFSQVYSAYMLMEIFKEAGVPDGVINLVFVDGPEAGDVIFNSPDFAGIHFTGSTQVFKTIWKTIGENIDKYKNYPRIVGETGGKDYIFAHSSADTDALAIAMLRGAFEFQGQKCSAASRAYIPKSLWGDVEKKLVSELEKVKMGSPEDFSNFVNAVINEKSFDKIVSYIEDAKNDPDVTLVYGGEHDKSEGYFIQPTVFLTKNPKSTTMCEEIFGPVITVYLYDEADLEGTIDVLKNTSPYGLTGAIFSQDRFVAEELTRELRHTAGNFYINDKPTGAVVGQQPFGGGRASGTNDKAGSMLNMLRWVSARTIKETFVPAKDWRYPFMGE